MRLAFITRLPASAKAVIASKLEETLEARADAVDDECPHCEQEAKFMIDCPFELDTLTKAFLQQLIDALREP